MQKSVGVLVLTYNGLKHLPKLFEGLAKSTLPVEILCVDSSSTDGTIEYFIKKNIKYHIISNQDFNHGATRELGRKLLKTDIVVMMTQDAYIVDGEAIERLVRPIDKEESAVTYGRQIPRKSSTVFEEFPRTYNYPEQNQQRDIGDVGKYGIQTFFCSDSFSAYSQKALDAVGGIPTILTHEDYYATAKLLRAGFSISYVADAVVEHSHNYGIIQEFKRYFDAGYVRAKNPWVDKIVGQAERRGLEYAIALLRTIMQRNIVLLPYAMVLIMAKWFGFRIGYLAFFNSKIPAKSLSSEKSYWNSKYFDKNRIYE